MSNARITNASSDLIANGLALASQTDFGSPTYAWTQISGQPVTINNSTTDTGAVALIAGIPYVQQLIGFRLVVTDPAVTGAYKDEKSFWMDPLAVDDVDKSFQSKISLVGGRNVTGYLGVSIRRAIANGNAVVANCSINMPNGNGQNSVTFRKNDEMAVLGGLGSATRNLFAGHLINVNEPVSPDRKDISFDFSDAYRRLIVDSKQLSDADTGYMAQTAIERTVRDAMGSVAVEYSDGGGAVRSIEPQDIGLSEWVAQLNALAVGKDSVGTYVQFIDGRFVVKREPVVGVDEPDFILHPEDVDAVVFSNDVSREINKQVVVGSSGVRYLEEDLGHQNANQVITGGSFSDESLLYREQCKESGDIKIRRSRRETNRFTVVFREGYRAFPYQIIRLSHFDMDTVEIEGDYVVQDVSIAITPDSYNAAVTLGRALPRFSSFT